MADDALTRKEAEMGRLTRTEIEKLRDSKYPWAQLTKLIHGLPSNSYAPDEAVRALCDLALRALSLESVREEALADAWLIERAMALRKWCSPH